MPFPKNRLCLIAFLLLTTSAFAQNWSTDFDSALAQSTESGKNILLVFSGSDWCAPCIRLDKTVWQSAEFKKDAENWILVKADFPRKKSNALPTELQAQNASLAEKYNRDGNFPLVVVIDPNGKVLRKMTFANVSASDYIAQLHAATP